MVSATKSHDLLVTRDLDEHLALAGAQPVLGYIVCCCKSKLTTASDRLIAANLVVGNGATLNADFFGEFLLRKDRERVPELL